MKVVTLGPFTYNVFDSESELEGYKEGESKIVDGIASEVESAVMKSFAARTFANLSIEKIVIPDGVDILDDEVFINCHALTEVVFTENSKLNIIRARCFQGCNSLRELTWLPNLKAIEDFAFRDCASLRRVDISSRADSSRETKLKLSFGCFYGCVHLEELNYNRVSRKNKVTIDDCAFKGCTSLRTFRVSGRCELKLADGVFHDCRLEDFDISKVTRDKVNLEGIVSLAVNHDFVIDGDFILDLKRTRLFRYSGCSEDVYIPNHVEVICRGCFFHNTSVRRIHVANDSELKRIEEGAFQGCFIESISVPASVTKFKGMNDSLSEVRIALESPNLYSDDTNMIMSSDNRVLYHYFGCLNSITIPCFVNEISSHCFRYNKTLNEVHFESGSEVMQIGKFAFSETNICSIEIPSSVSELGSYCFHSCEQLSRVTFESDSQLKTIMDCAFMNCISLMEVEFPTSLNQIGSDGFRFSGLRSVVITPTIHELGKYCFCYCENLETVSFSGECSLLELSEGLFGYSGLTSICIPRSVQRIEDACFYCCRRLTYVTFEKGSDLEKIGQGCFYETLIGEICLPKNIKHMNKALMECRNLRRVHFEPGLSMKSITGYRIFYNSPLVVLEIPRSVEYVSHEVMRGIQVVDEYGHPYCSSIQEWIDGDHMCVPASVKRLEETMFRRTNLKHVRFECPSLIQVFPTLLFAASTLESIVIPKSVTHIGAGCIRYCKALKHVEFEKESRLRVIKIEGFIASTIREVKLPRSLEEIHASAFESCSELSSVEFDPECQLVTIEERAFKSTPQLKRITLPHKLRCLGKLCFYMSGLEQCYFTDDSEIEELTRHVFNGSVEVYLPQRVKKINSECLKNIGKLHIPEKNPYLSMFGSYVISEQYSMCGTVDSAIKSVLIPKFVRVISKKAFFEIPIEELEFEEDSALECIKKSAFEKTCITQVSFPRHLQNLEQGCFRFCKNLQKIVFADDCPVTDIYQCFAGCEPEYIYISRNISSAYVGRFKHVEISNHNKFLRIENSCLVNNEGMLLSVIGKPVTLDLPDSVTSTHVSALDMVQGVNISENSLLTTFADGTFIYGNLQSIIIPRNITVLGRSCFGFCKNLRSVKFQEGSQLREIKDHVFAYCNLTELEIPKQLEIIGSLGLECTIENLVIHPGNTFFGLYDNMLMELTKQRLVMGIGKDPFPSDFTLPDCVKVLGSYCMFGVKFTHLSLENGTLEEIQPYVCFRLDGTLVIPSTVTRLGEFCFTGVPATEIVFQSPARVEVFAECAFDECYKLERIVVPDSVVEIKSRCFFMRLNLSALKEVTFAPGSSLKYIHNEAFSTSAITCIALPRTVRYIGDRAFSSCESLKSVTFESGSELISIGSCAFKDNFNLFEMIIPATVQRIGADAFDEHCSLSVEMHREIETEALRRWCETRVGPFELERDNHFYLSDDFYTVNSLGSGSQGSVRLIRHRFTSEEYAVKEVTSINANEIDIMKKLQHPCIIKIEGFRLNPPSTLCMEYASGGSLSNLLSDPPEWFDSTAKAKVIVGICHAMSFMHSQMIIHRDLKPSNILISNDHIPKICDFGFSKFEDGCVQTICVGTNYYMAPEVYDGNYCSKIDVFSFGVILYEVLEGRHPFSDIDTLAALQKVVKSHVRPPFRVCESIDMQSIIQSCLDPIGDNRPTFDTILALLQDIDFQVCDGVDFNAVHAFLKSIERK